MHQTPNAIMVTVRYDVYGATTAELAANARKVLARLAPDEDPGTVQIEMRVTPSVTSGAETVEWIGRVTATWAQLVRATHPH